MKKVIFTLGIAASTLASSLMQAQGVGINNDNTDPSPSAMLDVKSTNKGLLIPRMSSAQRAAIASPAKGLMVFDNQTNSFWYHNGTVWTQFLGGTDSDNQALGFSGSTLSISGGNAVNLSSLNTDNQRLNITSNRLEIDRGNAVDLSPYLDNTDNQRLTLVGNRLTIDRGNFVDIVGDNLGNHSATTTLDMNSNDVIEVATLSGVGVPDYDKLRVWNSSSYTIGMNSAMTYGYLGDYAMTFTMNQDDDRGWIFRDINDSKADGAMSLTTNGRLTVKGQARFQDLSGIGTRMVVANATGELSTQAVLNQANNGLTANTAANAIQLGGDLIQATTINLKNNPYKFNLDGTGDFDIQIDGVNKFAVVDNNTILLGDDVYFRDANTLGINLAVMEDDDNDGRFRIMENGIVAIDLDANTHAVFNEQGLNRDFRVESDADANMLLVDASTNNLGVKKGNPAYTLDIEDNKTNTGAATLRVANRAGGPLAYQNGPAVVIEIPNISYGERNVSGVYFNRTRENVEWVVGTEGGVFGNAPAYPAPSTEKFFISRTLKSNNTHQRTRPIYSNNTFFVINNDGTVGLGMTNPTYKLMLPNNSVASAGRGRAFSWDTYSDGRLKSNRTPISYGLKEIMQIEALSYHHHNSTFLDANEDRPKATIEIADTYSKQIGFIAQDLARIIPEAVTVPTNEEAELWSVDYTRLVPVLVKATQEQQVTIEVLKAENKTLKTNEAAAQAKIEALEAKLNRIEAALEKSGLLND